MALVYRVRGLSLGLFTPVTGLQPTEPGVATYPM